MQRQITRWRRTWFRPRAGRMRDAEPRPDVRNGRSLEAPRYQGGTHSFETVPRYVLSLAFATPVTARYRLLPRDSKK